MTSNRHRKLAFAAAIATMAALFTLNAEASQRGTDVPQAIVRYGDLDINTDAGAMALYQRIAKAAEQVCPAFNIRDARQAGMVRSCRSDSVERAIAGLGNTRLAAIQAQRGARNRVG